MATAVCVIHIVWAPLGLAPVETFLRSYKNNPAGAPHRLVVIYNGFRRGADLTAFRTFFEGVPHAEMVLPDPVQDIEAYAAAAAGSSERWICLMNSYCEILAPDWLQLLVSCAAAPTVGAAGASGSAESHLSAVWGDISGNARSFLQRRLRDQLGAIRHLLRVWIRYRAFPNFHLRTNALLVEREQFLAAWKALGPIGDKAAAEQFESGRRGLTARLMRSGRRVRVVGRDGRCYPPEEWRASGTFRSRHQENLLVADNRTRQYALGDPALRATLAQRAWGDPKAAVGG